MKKILILLIACYPVFVFSEAKTLDLRNIGGNWQSHYGFGVTPPTDATKWSLQISPEDNIAIRALYVDGTVIVSSAKKEDIKYFDDLIMIPFLGKSSGASSKLVLSGWENHGTNLIFGMLYYYSNGEMFNGIPMSFIQKTDNKSLNTGAPR